LSNNYTHVAFAFDAGTAENANKIRDSIIRRNCYVEVEHDGPMLTLTSENVELEPLVDLLRRAMQSMHDVPSPQGFEWAVSSDKHRVGDFGGGAVVIRRGKDSLKSIDTAEWLVNELNHRRES
jgi:hypothetical protein